MLKKKKIGTIIWGGILFFLGGILISTENTVHLGVCSFIVSAVFLMIGIRNVILVNRYNRSLEETYRGLVFRTNCIHCGYYIEADLYSFQPHRNYPEGFVYCPVCKKPVSKNAFHTEPDDSGDDGQNVY